MNEDALIGALALVCLALFISMCLNIIFYMRHRNTLCKEPQRCCHPHSSEEETVSQIEGRYVCEVSHQEEQENPHDHHEQQENPIYGNINTERRGSSEVCYETMSRQLSKDFLKPSESDLNYASLDLKIAKKHKKHRHLKGQGKGRHKQQDLLLDHLSCSSNAFLEVDTEVEAHLPPRDTGLMVSHSSIYLNSQQIAQEAEDMGRERGVGMEGENAGWNGSLQNGEGGRNEWNDGQGIVKREDPDDNNGSICVRDSEVETIQSCSDRVTDSFSHDSDLQDI